MNLLHGWIYIFPEHIQKSFIPELLQHSLRCHAEKTDEENEF